MAFVEYGIEGALNGTTYVDAVAAPSSGTRRLVKNLHFSNRDTVEHTIVVYKYKGGTLYELARESLSPGEYWTFEKITILDATDEKLQVKTLAATTTTAPSYDSAYADVS